MKEIKNDLRYVKTKEVIYASFYELLRIMPYDKITVSLLTERARINRKTFYLHYDTLEDLRNEMIKEIVLNGISCIQQYTIPRDLKQVIFAVYSYWQSLTEDDRRVYHLSSAAASSFTFAQQMRNTFTNFDQTFCNGDLKQQKTTLAFIVNAMGVCYREWTIYQAVSSIEEAVEMAYSLITGGIMHEDNR